MSCCKVDDICWISWNKCFVFGEKRSTENNLNFFVLQIFIIKQVWVFCEAVEMLSLSMKTAYSVFHKYQRFNSKFKRKTACYNT